MSHDPGVFDRDFDNPYQAPKAGNAPGPAPHGSGPRYTGYAGFLLRCAALFIDGCVVGVMNVTLFILIGVLVVTLVGEDPGESVQAIVGLLVLAAIAAADLGYFVLMESSSAQATVGKMALGLKVTDVYGRRLTVAHSLGRNLAKILSYLIFSIGFLIAAFDGRKQALHDKIANSLVMKTR